eukprot:UN13390
MLSPTDHTIEFEDSELYKDEFEYKNETSRKRIGKLKNIMKSIYQKPDEDDIKTETNEDDTATTMDSFEGIEIDEKRQSENNKKLDQFFSAQTAEDIERIVNKYNDETKDKARNYWFIGKKIAEYFNKPSFFKDHNTVVVVSEKDKLPQISDNHFSVNKFYQILEDNDGNFCGLDIMIYRTIGHQTLNRKYKDNAAGHSFQKIVLGLSGLYDDPNKIANELTKIYG